MNLDEALKTFIIESRELLEQMEDALLRIEQARARSRDHQCDLPRGTHHQGISRIVRAGIYRGVHACRGKRAGQGAQRRTADRIRSGSSVAGLARPYRRAGRACGTGRRARRRQSPEQPRTDQPAQYLSRDTRPRHNRQKAACRWNMRPVSNVPAATASRPTTGTSRCASARTYCATAWIPCPSSVT